jgi:cyclase
MKCTLGILPATLCVLLLAGLPSLASGQGQPGRKGGPGSGGSSPISVQNVRGKIYQVKGGAGANTGFFVAGKEVLVIDAKMTEDAASSMMAEIKKVTPNPITRVALTHGDGDHVNGLVAFPQGIQIISQENTRASMSKASEGARQQACLPNITFSDKLSLYLAVDGKTTRVDLLYFGPAHTNGDAVVFFPEEKVAFVGDLVTMGRDPLIHRQKGGDPSGLVKVLKALLALEADTFLSGHADPATRKDVEDLVKRLEEKQAGSQGPGGGEGKKDGR